jgi:hypothetical protein
MGHLQPNWDGVQWGGRRWLSGEWVRWWVRKGEVVLAVLGPSVQLGWV